jgi:NDP-sugar pyrophosphorylase family protein
VTLPAVVMAAGLGMRMRPLTDDVAKPALPIDGQPVVVRLLRELAEAGCREATVVTGYLAEQVERLVGDGSALGVPVRTVRQPAADGSADAVRCAGIEPPYLVLAADTVFRRGDVARFAAAFRAAAGAIAIRRHAAKDAIRTENGRVLRVTDRGSHGQWSGAPLWAVGPAVHANLCLDEPPYELGNAFQRAIDAGEAVLAIEIGATRDLTRPLDLLEQNFSYLKAIR